MKSIRDHNFIKVLPNTTKVVSSWDRKVFRTIQTFMHGLFINFTITMVVHVDIEVQTNRLMIASQWQTILFFDDILLICFMNFEM